MNYSVQCDGSTCACVRVSGIEICDSECPLQKKITVLF